MNERVGAALIATALGIGYLVAGSPDDNTGRLEIAAEVVPPLLPASAAPPSTVDVEAATVSASAVRGAQQFEVVTTTTTPLPVWMGGLPAYYGAGSECTRDEASRVARAMWAEGANDWTVDWMLTIISRESTCDPAAHNDTVATGDDSWGLCQLNARAGFFESDGILAEFDRYRFAVDFDHSAQACARLWAVCGRGPWIRGDYGCRVPEELR